VFAFLGRNGAGKTTTIRILLDLLDRNAGTARLLGLDSIKQVREIRRRVGYVAQHEDLYDWMTVERMLWFCRGFYPTWDAALVTECQAKLDLPNKTVIRQLSRGKQTQLALLLAMAFRPELLILDEPTAGLDAVVRREFFEEIISLIQEDGRTIFFSSHLVNEVERLADWVGIMDAGKLIYCAPVEELKARTRRIICRFAGAPPSFASLPGILQGEAIGKELLLTTNEFSEDTLGLLRQRLQPQTIQVEDMGLEDIFVAMVGERKE
jgi:ABC-2 type transport system ATP-binding protein